MQTYAYGFPRLGKNREFKRILEDFWVKKITDKELVSSFDKLEEERISIYKNYVDEFVLGEFTYYDNIFDTSLIFGVYKFKNFDEYFDYARGKNALELRKYFNTNYHYLVPTLTKSLNFSISWNKPLFYFNRFFSFKDNPVFMIGPYTFLKLSKCESDFEAIFAKLCNGYKALFKEFIKDGIKYVHLEEPAFCLDVPKKEIKLIKKYYKEIIISGLKINLITYYESVDFLKELYELPFYSIGLDFVLGLDNLLNIKKLSFPKDKKIICGIIDGRSCRRVNIFERIKFLEKIKKLAKLKEENIIISNSCPLFHLPFTIENEEKMDNNIRSKISFAKERLYELFLIKEVWQGNYKNAKIWSREIKEEKIKIRKKIFNTLSLKNSEFLKRKKIQKNFLGLPLFPTTTIGSFPQDKEVRKMRSALIKGSISLEDYNNFISNKILNLIEKEEELNLDVLVHGEFERSDMVEFFAKELAGFTTTENGWIISYGSRVYRPPIIYDRIYREKPLTLREIITAQSFTNKPVKGIITGPITILAWSYNLRNVPSYEIAFELAKALNNEVKQLVENGIKIIQIDEPAIREFMPLKKKKVNFYFSWATRSFNITARLPSHIQVHTHMCYSEFKDIINWIMKMNFDVITIETAREKGKIIDYFKNFKFNRAIGPGVWDVHSAIPATTSGIEEIVKKSIKQFGPENIWINPDCGLKTRDWPEVELSLKNMVDVAKKYREKFKNLFLRKK